MNVSGDTAILGCKIQTYNKKYTSGKNTNIEELTSRSAEIPQDFEITDLFRGKVLTHKICCL